MGGAEHRSAAEFDESGVAPAADPHHRLTGDDETRQGYSCYHYDANDVKFTTPYAWQHCLDMAVGQTYEVHWPHSAIGACGTPYQYQTPFYDGVFCKSGILSLKPLNTYMKIGVQSQTFTIVNDESYYYPDLMRSNTVCSRFTPITWQVD